MPTLSLAAVSRGEVEVRDEVAPDGRLWEGTGLTLREPLRMELRAQPVGEGLLVRGRISTALELDWIEDLQLCGRGEAATLLRSGATRIGGRIPVNPSGGLACFGEAVPAQALAQVCELTWQLRGQAGDRQVADAKVGITANQGLFGHGSSVIVKR